MLIINIIQFLFFLAAYKHADGKKIDGRRVLVDVERGRTVKGWRPRRLGSSFSMFSYCHNMVTLAVCYRYCREIYKCFCSNCLAEYSKVYIFYVVGGGLGSTRKGGSDVNTKYSGRDDFDTRER